MSKTVSIVEVPVPIGEMEREVARQMLRAQTGGSGVVAEAPRTIALLAEWETLGWVASHLDEDGERVYLLTFAGQAAILGGKGGAPS